MASAAALLFLFAFIFRYLRLVGGIFANVLYKPYPIACKPRYRQHNVTVIVPTTFNNPAELVQCLRSIMKCSPSDLCIVTINGNVQLVRDLCSLNSIKNIKVLGVEKLNKRHQMLRGIREVDTEITVFADDDVFWPANYLDHLLAIFENHKVGAGGTRQRVRRALKPNFWNFLGIAYLERRVWNNTTTNAIDGSISTLSGRTAAYRTKILNTTEFSHYFQNDSFRGRILSGDDDKALTRYVFSHGWEIAIQTSAVIETSLEDNPKFIDQCMRWARGHFRGNLLVMLKESYWCSLKYIWGFYVIYIGQWQTPALLVDGTLFGLLAQAVKNESHEVRTYILSAFGIWVIFTKLVKLIPHFYRHPGDLKFIPIAIAFSYLHGILNVYALCTLRVMSWGSQKLEELEQPKAQDEKVVPLLREVMADVYGKVPTPGKTMTGKDYFSATSKD